MKTTFAWMGFLLCSAAVTLADVQVTFQVDMSVAAFDTNTQSVVARGSFNSWNPFPLTNNHAGANPLLFSGTTNIPGNGTVMSYKYTIEPGAQYEGVRSGGGHNRLITLPTANGSSVTLPKVYFGDAPPADITVPVTFQLDLAQQANTGAFNPISSLAYARGFYNNWTADAGNLMTNNPSILRTNQNGLVTSNVYVLTFNVTGSPGQTLDYKYFIDTGANWESPAPNSGDPADNNNRFFNLANAPAQTLPIVFFNDSPYSPVATNAVTFQVDLSAQVLSGAFDPATGVVEVRGDFNSWGTPQIFATNNPAAANTNLYKAVVPIADGVGAFRQYKFWATVTENGGWETMANNRAMQIVTGTAQTLPSAYFSNLSPFDLLPTDTLVTFSVNMTNAVGTDSHAFDPALDQVYINGVYGFVSWGPGFLPQLTNNPVGSRIYSIELLLPKGTQVQRAYKYSINGPDNEAGANNNHVRYVRNAGQYTLPRDTFGNQRVEPSFGQLTVGPASAGRVPVSWLGRPGVHLQTKADLTPGSWQDLLNTDGAGWTNGTQSADGLVSLTNYPTTAAKTFLRLIKQ